MGWFCPFVCVSFPVGQPDPNDIANTKPDPPTSADREVPIHGWRLVVAPCGLVMWLGFGVCCAQGFQGAISLLSWFCFADRFSVCSLTGTYTWISSSGTFQYRHQLSTSEDTASCLLGRLDTQQRASLCGQLEFVSRTSSIGFESRFSARRVLRESSWSVLGA